MKPPKISYPQPIDVALIPRRMVRFIIEGFIRQVVSEMRKDLPDYELDIQESYNKALTRENYRRIIDIMDEKKMGYQDMKYMKDRRIKVEFTDE